MTTITKIKGSVQGELRVLTRNYGIVENTDEGVYLAALEGAGVVLDETRRKAVGDFFAKGKMNGWLRKLLYALPFIGDGAHPESARLPLVDRFHGYGPIGIGRTGEGVLDDIDFSDAITADANGNITGIRPWAGNACVVTPLTAYDLFAKYGGCSNVGNGNYGVIWYGKIADLASGATGRMAGAGTNTSTENYLGISTEGQFLQKIMGREVRSTDLGTGITAGGFHLLTEDIQNRAYGRNITRYRLRGAALPANTEVADETAERADVTDVPDELKETRWAVNGHWNHTTQTVTHSNVTADMETRFVAWHDGTLDDEATFIPALRELLSAFGKLSTT